jgi:diguanylate cyclase (GGDEF)-like protein
MPLRSLVGTIGLAVAALVTLAGPIGYATVSYLEQAEILSFKAQLNADRLAKYIYSHDKLWQYQSVRLTEIVQLPQSEANPVRQRILDLSGKVVLEEGAQLSGPLLRRSAPIVVNSAVVGHVEALTSLTHFCINVGLITLVSFAIGFGAYLAFRVLPLRVLDRTLDELKTQHKRFSAAVNNMPIGLVMFDSSKRLVVGNDRYREMYGLPHSVTKPGTHLREMLEHRLQVANFEGDRTEYVERILKLVEQKETSVRVVPLGDGRTINIIHHPTEEGWIGTHEDVTEREGLHSKIARQNERLTEQERQLKTQNLQLDAALENISQGLSMFDRDQRLVLCNERYLEMYGLSSAQAAPGIGVLQLLELRVACGSYPKGPPPAAYVAELVQSLQNETAGSTVMELNDGRFIAVTSRAMPDGGWVATHEDVTASMQREELLRAQNFRFDTALNNMSHGLCMFDAQHRLVVCNENFGQIYGLPPDLMTPGASLRQIVQHRVDQGLYVADGQDNQTQQLFAAVSQNSASTRVTELTDGRAIVIKHRPMPDGGFVATHEDITEQRIIEARIKHMAHHDALTDLPNRVLVRERLDQAISQAPRSGLAVLCLDLDRFKEVNDTMGHPVGDALLRSVADRLRGCVRQTDTVARLGGDEFAVAQIAPNQPMDATALAARIVEAISTAHDLNGQDIVVGTSIGIAMFPDDGTDADQLLRNADLALYRAKSEGRGTYRFFEKGMDERMQARRMLERDLRTAIAKGEFELYYQPLIELDRNEVSGFEALLRWNHPERGRVSPVDFIPLAEETGLIVPIGEWVLRQACAEAATWPTNIKVAVNLSPVQFMAGSLVAVVFNALTASGLAASRLELEITETVLLQNGEATLATLHKLRDLGVSISMDDFGTGYSSLSYLRSFPFDKIKIDQSFVRDINENGQAQAIVHAVTSLGASLGMRTTAEGVETREQLEQLRVEGCTEVQGYYFSPPKPAGEVLALLNRINCKSIAA